MFIHTLPGSVSSAVLYSLVTALPVSTFTQTVFCVRLDTSTQLHLRPSGAEPSMDRQTDLWGCLPACQWALLLLKGTHRLFFHTS